MSDLDNQYALDELLQAAPFARAEDTPVFARAVSVCVSTLRERFPKYAAFLDREPHSSADDNLPALFLPVIKSYPFSLPADLKIAVNLTSSGTSGRSSETPLDEPSWCRRVQAMRGSYEALGLLTGELHALAFLLDPATTRLAGSLVIDAVLRSVPNVRSVTYLARLGGKGPEFPPAEAVTAMCAAIQKGPVVLVGYPALIAAGMHALIQSGRERFSLPSGSCILTGGGWKSFLPGVNLEQSEFRAKASQFFGVPMTAIRDMFGLSECPAVFVQCEHGRYHVPVWARAQAIDPETGRDVPPDEVGLLQLTVPLTTSYPLVKILTTDRAIIQSGCPCGRSASFLVPCGRVTAARFETCAMKIGRAVGDGGNRP